MIELQHYPGRIKFDEVIHTNQTNSTVITDLCVEFNLHSSIGLSSCIGELMVSDYQSYFAKSAMNAGDDISVKVDFPDETRLYNFKIKAVENIKNMESGFAFILKLVSPMAYESIFKRISFGEEELTHKIAQKVFDENKTEGDEANFWEESASKQTLVIPYWSPMKTLEFLAKRSKSKIEPQRFMFFQDSKLKYNFCSYSYLRDQYTTPVFEYTYHKNTAGQETSSGVITNTKAVMENIIEIDFLNSFNIEKSLKNNSLLNTKIRYDFVDGDITIDTYDYWSNFKEKNMNRNDQWNTLAEKHDGNILIENMTRYDQGTDLREFNMNSDEMYGTPAYDKSQEIEIVVVGNKLIDVGCVIKVNIPAREPETRSKQDLFDPRWSGLYYITAKRDVFDRRSHKTVLRCTKNTQV